MVMTMLMGAVAFNICSSLLINLSIRNTTVIHSPLHITTQLFEAVGCMSPSTAGLTSVHNCALTLHRVFRALRPNVHVFADLIFLFSQDGALSPGYSPIIS